MSEQTTTPPAGDERPANGRSGTDGERELVAEGRANQRRHGGWGSMAMPVERSNEFTAALKRLGRLLSVERAAMTAVVVLAVSSVVLIVIGPKILGSATDVIFRGVISGQGIDFPALHRTLLTVAAIYVGAWALAYAQAWLLAGLIQRTMHRLRESVEEKMNRLPLAYIDRQPRGDLLSRVTNDIDNVAQSLQQTISQIMTSTLTIVGVTIMMFTISPLLAAVALVTVPGSLWAMKAIGSRARPRYIAQWTHTGALNAQVEEAFNGHAIVKTFGRRHEVEERFRDENDDLYESSFGAQFMASLIQPAMVTLGNVQYALIAVVGGLRIASGAITVGDMQAFIQYARQFAQPLTQLASMATVFQSGVASVERVFEFLDAPEEIVDPPVTVDPPAVRGRVVFDDVHFSYHPDEPLIEGLSLVAEPGQTVAIVGPTGAGKTTLVNLIMRFYELDGGAITLDGRDISSFPRAELRSRIGMVLQDTWLFGGTIRENIAYGRPERERGRDPRRRPCHLRRPLRPLAARRLRHGHQRGGRQHQRRREAAAHHRPRLPGRPGHPHPRRGHQLGGHPHRDADPGGHERAPPAAHELRDRPPAVDHPRCRHHPGDGGRPDRGAGQPRRAAGPKGRLPRAVQLPVRRGGHRGGLSAGAGIGRRASGYGCADTDEHHGRYPMPGRDPGPSIKDDEQYEALRDEGMSKEKAARIANSDRTETAKKGGSSPAYEDWTKDDLYEKAQDVGIEGRSDMNKDELIDALRNH